MRYYAGNWAHSVWLLRTSAAGKSNVISRPQVRLQRFNLNDSTIGTLLKPRSRRRIVSRAMHLHGRVLQETIRYAVDDTSAYQWLDGEVIAGWLLGWNFGDGHLHDERLLAAVQERCQFQPGQLRCILVESQPIHRKTLAWRIVDAHDGEIRTGTCDVAQLKEKQPFDLLKSRIDQWTFPLVLGKRVSNNVLDLTIEFEAIARQGY